MIDVAVAIVAFCLTQVVHHYQIQAISSSSSKDTDGALVGFSVGSSVYELVQNVSGTVGIVAEDPLTKLGATVVVAVCGASRAVLKTGTTMIKEKSEVNK